MDRSDSFDPKPEKVQELRESQGISLVEAKRHLRAKAILQAITDEQALNEDQDRAHLLDILRAMHRDIYGGNQ